MIIDNNLYLSPAQVDVRGVAVWPSTNVIDLTQTLYRVAYNNPMWLISRVTVAFGDAGTNAVLTTSICTNNTADATTPNIYWSDTVFRTSAMLILNYEIVAMRLPDRFLERYLLMTYAVTVGAFNAGQICTFLTPDKPEPFLL